MKNLGFGCMRFPLLDKSDPKNVDIKQLIQMVDTYLERGFTYFDTAYFYHDNESERIVKKVLVERHPRDSFVLADKLPVALLEKKEDMERIFNEQFEKTGVEYFDYYLIHCFTKDYYKRMQDYDGFDFILKKKKEGKFKKLGFSFHDTADVLDKILTEHPEFEFVQLQINYFDWESDSVQSRKCHEVAVKHGKDIIVMEPVRGGALANVPPKAERLFNKQNPDMSVASWAVRYAASLENVFMVLSGMSDMAQLLDNMSYMDNFKPLTETEKALCLDVAEIIKTSVSVPCTACKYCVDGCPIGINIPEYFGLYNNLAKEENRNFEEMKAEYKKLSAKSGRAIDCIGCGRCEEHCPQHIEIIDSLKLVTRKFED